MSPGIAGGLVEPLEENPAKGVKVETKNDETTIDLYVIGSMDTGYLILPGRYKRR